MEISWPVVAVYSGEAIGKNFMAPMAFNDICGLKEMGWYAKAPS